MQSTQLPFLEMVDVALGLAFCLTLSNLAQGQTGSWNGTTGDWTDTSRWDTANFPDMGSGIPNAIINYGNVNLYQAISAEKSTDGFFFAIEFWVLD